MDFLKKFFDKGHFQVGKVLVNPERDVFKIAKPAEWEQFVQGQLIDDRYKVLRIMRGGMGIIYVVFDVLKGIEYAVKSFRREFFSDENAWNRFESEIRIWIALEKHTNIVQAQWLQRNHGVPLIFLEYVSGTNLRNWLKYKNRNISLTLDFALQICDGMSYVWDKHHLVHRDLKPENVLVTQDERLKITDFGLAKVLNMNLPIDASNSESSVSPAGAISTQGGLGTLPYMAPELFDNAKDATVAVDIYAFGVMLYEMLTGYQPFTGPDYKNQHKYGSVPELPKRITRSSAALDTMIQKCLAKKHEARFQSFRELQEELLPLYVQVAGKPYHARGKAEPLTAFEWTNKGSNLCTLGDYERGFVFCKIK